MLGFGRYVHKALHFYWVWMTGGTLDLQLLAWTFCGGSWMEVILKLQRFVQPVLFLF
jgi:hypothetical protein